ncbi:MAG: rod shape-determining protein MreC [Epsilonproteobacteria bacterium]|nr:rod shape-determining protein MreC [Campylobacterota bacterium]
MNKKRVSILLFGLFALLLFLFGKGVHTTASDFTHSIKRVYFHIEQALIQIYERHFEQARRIEELQKRLVQMQKYQILYEALQEDLRRLQRECNATIVPNIGLRLVRVLSYVDFADKSAVWLDTKLEGRKLAGLLSKEYVAGIAIEKENKTMGLLNGNYKCSYGVKIGRGANGVAMGSGDNRFVIVRYIPNYEPIKVGDIVKTNGLDGIFAEGLKVGIVVQIHQEGSYKIAKVRTYADLRNPRYLWLMKL